MVRNKATNISEELPTVPDLECTKGYVYNDAIDILDDKEGEEGVV